MAKPGQQRPDLGRYERNAVASLDVGRMYYGRDDIEDCLLHDPAQNPYVVVCPDVSFWTSAAQSVPTAHRAGRLHSSGRPFDTALGLFQSRSS